MRVRKEHIQKIRQMVSMWDKIDEYTHDLAKHIRSQGTQEVTLFSAMSVLPYSAALRDVMKPQELFRYRVDVFTYMRDSWDGDKYLQLTKAGVLLSRSSVPDISTLHLRALADLAAAEALEINSNHHHVFTEPADAKAALVGACDHERLDGLLHAEALDCTLSHTNPGCKTDVEAMRSHIAPAEWVAFRAAVMVFCQTITKMLRQERRTVSLSELVALRVPEALWCWLERRKQEIPWFIDAMLSGTFVMRSHVTSVDGQWDHDDVYVSELDSAD